MGNTATTVSIELYDVDHQLQTAAIETVPQNHCTQHTKSCQTLSGLALS